MTLLRGAILASLEDAGYDGLLEDQIGPAVQRVLGFVAANPGRRAEWLVEPELKGANVLTAELGHGAKRSRTASGSISGAAGASPTPISSSSD